MKKNRTYHGQSWSWQKLYLIMRLTVILLFAFIFTVRANSYSQTTKLTLNIENSSLNKLLSEIEQQSGYFFYYNFNLDDYKNLNVEVKDRSIKDVLDLVLKNQGLSYEIVDRYVVIKKAGNSNLETNSIIGQQQRNVSGKITDNTKQPIPGVSVVVKGTTIGTISGNDGKYSLSNVPSNATLSFSFVGMKTKEVAVTNQSQIDVEMAEESIGIDEVVAIGYGTSKKEDLSAAVSVVQNIGKLKDRPVTSAAAMLQGRVAGVTISNQGGGPSDSPLVTIRGTGSTAESVLYVIDGVPYPPSQTTNSGSVLPYNPEDVESITILKDAASAAIYGASAGSAGVILITTRQAKEGKTSVEYSGYYGVKSAWKIPESLTAEQQGQVSNLAYANSGQTGLAAWDKALNPNGFVTRTDWMKEIFRTAQTQRHTITISGGSPKFSSLFQVRYENDEGTLLNTFNRNVSARYNATYTVNKYLRFREDLFWNNNQYRNANTADSYQGPILTAMQMPRNATVYYPDGTFGGVADPNSPYVGMYGDVVNPVGSLLRNQSYMMHSDVNATSEMYISNVIKGLEFVSRFSYRYQNDFSKNFNPMRLEPGKPNAQNSLGYGSGVNTDWLWENTLNYTRIFGKHNLGIMLSTTSKDQKHRGFSASATGLTSEADWAQFFFTAQNFYNSQDGQFEDRNLSYIGRLSYSYADRYFLTASYRQDIAGRLTLGNRAAEFPGVTGAWKISSEPWFKSSLISLLKVRASWGKIGNLGSVGINYGYPVLTGTDILRGSAVNVQVGNGAPITTALYVQNAFNSKLTWETSKQTDIGIDMTLFDKRLNIITDYFWKSTYGQIKTQDTNWPASMGAGAPLINQGNIDNSGLEFSATWTQKIGQVELNLGGNFATLKNEVKSISTDPTIVYSFGDNYRTGALKPFQSAVGQPYYAYWLVKTDGIFKSNQEAASYVDKSGNRIQPNAVAGDLKYIDANGDGTVTDADRQYMGSFNPTLTYGFTASLKWKNWDANLFFQGVGGVKIFNAWKSTALNASQQDYNRWNKILDAWSPTNVNSSIPRVTINDTNHNFSTNSDYFLENGDYFRLKNLMIGYTFDKEVLGCKARLYFSGDNLLTFTKYSGLDPEVGNHGLDAGTYPVSRVYSLGAKISF